MSEFSLLMSVYYKEKAEFLDIALRSIWDDQELKPAQIVLVKDGSLTDELEQVIKKWQAKLANILNVVALRKNVGLGDALNIGLKRCKFELVARMDSDDISVKNRFKKQIELFNNMPEVDVCGSNIGEFRDDENLIISERKLPQNHDEIVRFAKFRCPFNHMSVMYKKSVIEASGGYKRMLYFEDYYLWIRLLIMRTAGGGVRFYNIQENLVHVRISGLINRRSGLEYAKLEFRCLREFFRIGFFRWYEFYLIALLRFCSRMLPIWILGRIYKKLR